MTTKEILAAVISLMNRGPGIWAPTPINLNDGTSFDGIPCGINVGPGASVIIQFVDQAQTSLRVLKVDDIDSIG